MGPPASRRITRVLRYSGISLLPSVFVYEAFTLFRRPFQTCSTNFRFTLADPQPQKACSLVWAFPSSLAATERIDFSFLSSGYLDVSVPRVPSCKAMYLLCGTMTTHSGFPHSDVHGSMPACGSPWLFAAGHVLLRCLVPWHPPYALVRLIFRIRSVKSFA